MKWFIYTSLLSFCATASANSFQSCFAKCLGVDGYNSEILFLGEVSASDTTISGAWRILNGKCKQKVRHYGFDPVLANGIFSIENYSESYSSSYSRYESYRFHSFRFSRSHTLSEHASTYYNVEGRIIKLEFAHPGNSCFLEDGRLEDTEEYYEGDLPVQG